MQSQSVQGRDSFGAARGGQAISFSRNDNNKVEVNKKERDRDMTNINNPAFLRPRC